jgi:hypothetical protein
VPEMRHTVLHGELIAVQFAVIFDEYHRGISCQQSARRGGGPCVRGKAGLRASTVQLRTACVCAAAAPVYASRLIGRYIEECWKEVVKESWSVWCVCVCVVCVKKRGWQVAGLGSSGANSEGNIIGAVDSSAGVGPETCGGAMLSGAGCKGC